MATLVPEAAPAAIRVGNLSRARDLVVEGRVADNAWARLRGLIGRRPLTPGAGLLIVPCNSIHTHFMGFPIDAVYVSREGQILGIDRNLQPWRFGHFFRHVRFVIELPAGTVASTGTEVGDRLQVQGYVI